MTNPDDIEKQIAEVLEKKDDRAPPAVVKFLDLFSSVQQQTARHCIELAEWFEAEAASLRNHSVVLNHQAQQIPDDLRQATTYEVNVRERMQFLAALKK